MGKFSETLLTVSYKTGALAQTIYPLTSGGAALGIASTNEFSGANFASGAALNFDNGDVTLTHSSNNITLAGGNLFTNEEIRMGNTAAAPRARFDYNSAPAVEYLNIIVDTFRNIVISEDPLIDWAHANGADPTLYIQSSDSTSVADYINFRHNQTNAVVTVGAGDLVVSIAGTSLLPGANDQWGIGAAANGISDIYLATGAKLDFGSGDMTVTHSAELLVFAGGGISFTLTAADDQFTINDGTARTNFMMVVGPSNTIVSSAAGVVAFSATFDDTGGATLFNMSRFQVTSAGFANPGTFAGAIGVEIVNNAGDVAGSIMGCIALDITDNGGSGSTAGIVVNPGFDDAMIAVDDDLKLGAVTKTTTFYGVVVQNESITTAASGQFSLRVTRTLNDANVAPTGKTFALIDGELTSTDTGNWEETYLIDLYTMADLASFSVDLQAVLDLDYTDEGVDGSEIALYHETTTPTTGDFTGSLTYNSQNDAGTQEDIVYAETWGDIRLETNGAETGAWYAGVHDANSGADDAVTTYITADGTLANQWVLISVDFQVDGGYISHDTSNDLFGTNNATHVNLGIASETGTTAQNYSNCTVGGGTDNTASAENSTVCGGDSNTAGATGATVWGGQGSEANGIYSGAGGFFTIAGGAYSIAWGRFIQPSGNHSFTVGYATDTASAFKPADTKAFILYADQDTAVGAQLILQQGSASLADGNQIGINLYRANLDTDGDTPGNYVTYGKHLCEIQDPASGSEESIYRFYVMQGAGALTEYLRLDGTDNITAVVASKKVDASTAGLQTVVSTDNVTNPPTDAEIDTAFGDPTTVGGGFLGVLDDAGGGANVWFCYTTGTAGEWFYVAGTKAV